MYHEVSLQTDLRPSEIDNSAGSTLTNLLHFWFLTFKLYQVLAYRALCRISWDCGCDVGMDRGGGNSVREPVFTVLPLGII